MAVGSIFFEHPRMTIRFLKAFNGDSIVISFSDSAGKPRNVLIDGGTANTYYNNAEGISGDLKTELLSIKEKHQKIDLMILTHIDNDHICGFLKWLELDDEAPALIDLVWFNSGRIIAQHFTLPENKDLDVSITKRHDGFTGVPEAIQFDKYLADKKIRLHAPIFAGHVYDYWGAKFEILTPTQQQLQKLLKEFNLKLAEEEIDPHTAGKKDWSIDMQTMIDEETPSTSKFVSDKSIKNGSSITFILTLNGKKFLFLADGHCKEIANGLDQLGYTVKDPLEVEVMKISHHGSSGNTSKALLQLVRAKQYVISTDSSVHGHPNKRTMARIWAINPNANICLNYGTIASAILTHQDLAAGKFKLNSITEISI